MDYFTGISPNGQRAGDVLFVGAGPGDPDLLTVRAHRALGQARVVLHDRLVSEDILALVNPAARLVEVGKTGFGPSIAQSEINALLVHLASDGEQVVRLKGGDPALFGRLDEEIEALDQAGIAWSVVPGITSASAASARIGRSLTRRGRNGALRIVTGHDAKGFADQDWRALAAEGAVTALYMGKRAARFVSGRLMMHGAGADLPVTIVENISRVDERIVATCLGDLPDAVETCDGPALILLGLAPHPRMTARSLPAELALSDFPFFPSLLKEASHGSRATS
ncbi:uroporphyrinogen-III C-methyltransferase [Thioclava sp. A2]|uniref:uroporphyrinogen-III C-methyltransferase n=1 Tax=Thioclava sp. FCG-A2 TaxID=3080562 RepID=UPI002954957C|nr:uroporphyrinogen-III C-methyltransferase [Thioclava sp. A2]MDV7271237.1 uroporphyrinogen-III C-methyltransferase [Thioclava sp. A2]